MRRSFGGVRVCIAVVALLGVRGSAAETWLRARTDHFEVFSSASETESRRILYSLEQFRAQFVKAFNLRSSDEPRTTVVMFGTDRAFGPYKPLHEGKPKEIAGYFLPAEDEVMIAMTTDLGNSEVDPTEVIFHEYTHLLLHARKLSRPSGSTRGSPNFTPRFESTATRSSSAPRRTAMWPCSTTAGCFRSPNFSA